MKYRTFGKTGYTVSEIGFGAWAIGGGWGAQDDAESVRTLHAALDRGVNFIDTAAVYGDGHSERIIGKMLKERSEDIIVATKTPPTMPGLWPPSPYEKVEDRYSEAYLRENIEQRLRNLDVECIDLLQLHTWTRAWNRDPRPFEILQKIKQEGKIAAIGISTPEHDQNSVIDLIRDGWVDTIQVIYNIFEQEPIAEILPVAQEHNVGVIIRVAMDEGALTGKFTEQTQFEKGDFRKNYFRGDRLKRVVTRVGKIQNEFADSGYSMPELALKFAMSHPAVSTVIAGMRNTRQVEMNTKVSDLPPLSEEVLVALQKHAWQRQNWHVAN